MSTPSSAGNGVGRGFFGRPRVRLTTTTAAAFTSSHPLLFLAQLGGVSNCDLRLGLELRPFRCQPKERRKEKETQRNEKETIAPTDILRQRRLTMALKAEKMQCQMKANGAKFERRKYDVYNQEMNPPPKARL